MDKSAKLISGIFILILFGIIIIEITRPTPLNWDPSYTSYHKRPFGSYIAYTELQTLFPKSSIETRDETPYTVLSGRDTLQSFNYIFVNSALDFDAQETNQLLRFVEQGNNAFMASTYFGYYLSDTLNIQVQSNYVYSRDTVHLSLTNSRFTDTDFKLDRGSNNARFTSFDTLQTTVLGYVLRPEDPSQPAKKEPNFIQVAFGKGNFYLNTAPEAFTNYYLLNGNQAYSAHTLSYLDDRALLWDDYLKAGRVVIDSPMRYVLNQAPLKWAYYLSVAGILVFVFFRAKREQRIIPVITPLENSSVEFARTMGNLYLQHRDYTDLIAKKSNYFMEYIRSRYYLNTDGKQENLVRDLSLKSGKPLKEIRLLIDYIQYLKHKESHTETELIKLNQKITSFKK